MASGRSGAGAPSSPADQSVEVSAKTVDEAVAKALGQLGCRREDVEVEVLHAGTPGRLLGFGAEPARVRVILLPSVARARRPVAAAAPADQAPAALAPATPATPAGATQAAEPETFEEAEEEEAVVEVAPTPASQAEDAELARTMLGELLNRMGVAFRLVDLVTTDPITLNIRGDDVADLIGRRGENLRALQFILNLMLNKQLHRHTRVIVDVDGYRARREELLRGMAHRFAHRVRVTREPMQLEAMPPNERRIIHLTLSEDPEVTTESIGEGDARRVVIKPRR